MHLLAIEQIEGWLGTRTRVRLVATAETYSRLFVLDFFSRFIVRYFSFFLFSLLLRINLFFLARSEEGHWHVLSAPVSSWCYLFSLGTREAALHAFSCLSFSSSVRRPRIRFCILSFFFVSSLFLSPYRWVHGWPGRPSCRKGEMLGASIHADRTLAPSVRALFSLLCLVLSCSSSVSFLFQLTKYTSRVGRRQESGEPGNRYEKPRFRCDFVEP